MSINIQIKGELEKQVNKAYQSLVKKKVVSKKDNFVLNMIEIGIGELYKTKVL
tara:strand:+ start:346 stop:504 length:159 start_codon:yes stop_codon:yes gene_type:complete